ncbi:FAD-dependent oxidoreductase [Candidatus Poribacteria bacterium]
MSEFIQLSKQILVVAKADVVVAGAGISGSIAALAAAREGADVVLIERYGCLGGNMGPGMFSGGVVHLVLHHPHVMSEGLRGIPGEFLNRCEGYSGHQLGHDYFKDSQIVSYVLLKMMEEWNVQLMLNTWVCDPIMENNHITGIFVEDKSGTRAVRAKVVINATGDADVAARAGVPTDPNPKYNHPGMYFAIGGVDEAKYQAFLDSASQPDPEHVEWVKDAFKDIGMGYPGRLNPLLPFIRRAWSVGDYRIVKRIGDVAAITVDHGFYPPRNGIVGAQVGLWGEGIDSGNAAQNTELERQTRIYIFETAKFMRAYVSGFEDSYLHMIAPFFHSRSGRSAVCDYATSVEDMEEGRRFEDVVFVNYGHEQQKGPETGNDFPYRQLLPKGVEGLMATGRSTIIQPPTNRSRWKMLLMGQVCGVGAALAARADVAPRSVDVKELQKILHNKYHVSLGDRTRLKELGILSS